MIITELKSLEEITDAIKDYHNILIAACGGCTTVHKTGGRKEAEALKAALEKGKAKFDVTLVPRQCDRQMVISALQPLIGKYDAVVSMGCGVGAQTIADAIGAKPTIPALNTKFIGMYDSKIEEFSEICKACGKCIIFVYGGICPITRCAKSLLNGPCGGQAHGKCEVGGWKIDCAWILIYTRLKAQGRPDEFKKFRPPWDFRTSNSPRELAAR